MGAALPEIIGIIRDVVFIVSLLFICFVIYRTARKINNVVDSAKRTVKKIENVIEFIASPSKGNFGFLRSIFKTFNFVTSSKRNDSDK